MALTDSLVSYWKLDESSGDATDSHGSNTLTNNGTMTYGSGIINNGAIPSSTGPKYLSITDAAQSGLGITGDFSFQFWANPSSQPPNDGALWGVMSKFGSSKGYYVIYARETFAAAQQYKLQSAFFDASSNQTRFVKYNGTTPLLPTSTWSHVVVTVDVSVPDINIYVNASDIGATADISAATSIGTNTTGFTLGQSLGATNEFNGTIDEVGIWSRALTSTEVTELYNGGAGLAYPFSGAAANTSNFFMFMDRR